MSYSSSLPWQWGSHHSPAKTLHELSVEEKGENQLGRMHCSTTQLAEGDETS